MGDVLLGAVFLHHANTTVSARGAVRLCADICSPKDTQRRLRGVGGAASLPGCTCLPSSSSPGLPPGSLCGINISLPFGCWALPGGLRTTQGTARWQEEKFSNCWALWWLRVRVHLAYPTPWVRGCTRSRSRQPAICPARGLPAAGHVLGSESCTGGLCLKLPGAGDVQACAAWIP